MISDALRSALVPTVPKPGLSVLYGEITPDGRLLLDRDDQPLEVTPPSLVAPLIPGRRVEVLATESGLTIQGHLGGEPAPQVLVAGEDYQTPLVAGVDYQTPIKLTQQPGWWYSQNGWSVANNSNLWTYGPMVSMTIHMKSPSSSLTLGANSAQVIARTDNTALKPPIETAFSWRTTNSFAGSGSFNTVGEFAINTGPSGITLPASTVLMLTVNFIKP